MPRFCAQPRRILTALGILAVMVMTPGCAAASSATASSATLARPTTAAVPASTAAAVDATNGLAIDGLRRLEPSANAVFSPLSIETALAMVDQGAAGTTRRQLDTLLGAAPSPAALAASNHLLSSALHDAVSAHGSGGPTLNSANAVWLQSGLSLVPSFATTLAGEFGAAPRQTDFAGDPSGATQAINAWVSQLTHGRIPSLMSPGQITAQTNLVLANAVYLNARWQFPFDPNQTSPASFHTPSASVSVPFMDSGTSNLPYAAVSGYQAVGLAYAHSSLQYLAVMPPAGKLGKLEQWLTPAHLSSLTRALRGRSVDLRMPKFKLSFTASLNGFLEGLGLTSPFTDSSQLPGMLQGRNLEISTVQHAATLAVAEKGTVAAAATGASLTPTAVAPIPALALTLNRPFIVLIRDTRTGAVLFAARVQDPAGS
jgi:serpin B